MAERKWIPITFLCTNVPANGTQTHSLTNTHATANARELTCKPTILHLSIHKVRAQRQGAAVLSWTPAQRVLRKDRCFVTSRLRQGSKHKNGRPPMFRPSLIVCCCLSKDLATTQKLSFLQCSLETCPSPFSPESTYCEVQDETFTPLKQTVQSQSCSGTFNQQTRVSQRVTFGYRRPLLSRVITVQNTDGDNSPFTVRCTKKVQLINKNRFCTSPAQFKRQVFTLIPE